MPVAIEQLPNDIDALKKFIVDLGRGHADEIARMKAEYDRIKANYLLLRREYFGPRTEKYVSPEQILFGYDPDKIDITPPAGPPEKETEVDGKKRKKRKRTKISSRIQRFEIHHDLPEEEKQGLRLMGTERSEKLVWITGVKWVEVHITYNYVRIDQESAEAEGKPGAISTCMPPQIMPGTIATPGLLAHILTSKFADGLPFYRQEKIFARHGVEIKMKTMCRWAIRVAELCGRLLELMLRDLLQGHVIGIDETRLKVLVKRDGKGVINGYLFLFFGGTPENPVLIYFYSDTRKTDFIAEILADYEGNVQTDGYQAYDKTLNAMTGIIHHGCWMHNRRPYFDAAQIASGDGIAHTALGKIRELYMVEREARGLAPEEILALRRKESQPIIKDFKKLIDAAVKDAPPRSKLGEAVSYSLNQWPKLIKFLDDGRIPIDTGRVENAIRHVVIGRKNFMHSGGPRGAAALAALYSITQTAMMNGHEPYWYFRFLLEMLPRSSTDEELCALLPNRLNPDKTREYAKSVEIPVGPWPRAD